MANEITWRLEHERIGRLLLHYAMPAVIGTMVNALYNIVDRIFIGQGVGPLAMAGLTLTFPILLFLQAFGMLIGAGAATRVSIYLGRRENEMAEKVLGNAFTLTFIITLATVVPCMIWMIGAMPMYTYPVSGYYGLTGFSGSITGGTGSGSGSSSRQEHVMHAMTAINKYPNVFIFFNFMFFILSPLSRRIPV